LYELQEYSELTYRLYDYGRLQSNGRPRELHVARGLDVSRFVPSAQVRVVPLEISPAQNGMDGLAAWRVLVGCRYFVLEELHLAGLHTSSVGQSSCQILSVLTGSCRLQTEGAELHLTCGDTAVLPASLGVYALEGSGARLVRSYVPTENDPALLRWRAAQPA